MRLRELHPILDADGACPIVFDVERTFTFTVPDELQSLLARGGNDLAENRALQSWLEIEDLLTADPPPSVARDGDLPVITDVSLDLSGSCNLRCVYCFEDDLHSRIGSMSMSTAGAVVDFVFRQGRGAEQVTFHFGSGEPLIQFELLRHIVAAAEARALQSGQRVAFELRTNGTLVTPEVAEFFAAHSFHVHFSCDGPEEIQNANRPFAGGRASYDSVRRGLDLLLDSIPSRLTINTVLTGGTRLLEVWKWVRAIGAERIIVIKVGASQGVPLNLRQNDLELFRMDLQAIADDLFDDLAAGRRPIDYQPLTNVVRRLMAPAPVTRYCHVAGAYVGVSSDGRVFPCFRHIGLEPYLLGDVRNGLDDQRRAKFISNNAAPVDERPICRECWARYLCGGGCYADSSVYGADPRLPQTQHCPFWRAEIESGIRLHRRLLDADPRYCLALFGEEVPAGC